MTFLPIFFMFVGDTFPLIEETLHTVEEDLRLLDYKMLQLVNYFHLRNFLNYYYS